VADPPVSPERSDRSGSLLAGRYRFERRIAVGGMAEVWEATDQVLDRSVAIKVLHPHLAGDQTFVERFRREAIAAARLTHPSIVAIYDTHSSDGEEAIVMELVRGTSLRQHLDEHGRLGPDEAVNITVRVAEALETAHRAGLVHRDIKPANILLCEDERVMVADFGIAKLTDADHTTEGTVLGTAKYLAPEQVQGGAVDARTDLYALGIVLYEMVCGRVPFSGDSDTATVLARLHQDATPPRQIRPDLGAPLEAVILHALERAPDDRPASAAGLRSELLAAVGPNPPSLVPPPPGGADATFLESSAVADGTSVVTPPSSPVPSPPTTPPPGAARPAAAPVPAPAPKPQRNWTGAVLLIALVFVALAVAGVLLGKVFGDQLFGDDTPTVPGVTTPTGDTTPGLTLTASAFDPAPGDGGEHDTELGNAVDQDPSTTWSTETYSSPDFGNLKDGVGLVLTLEQATELSELVVDSPTTGWSAVAYVADAPAADLAGWGEALDPHEGIDGTVSFDLGGRTGGAVLLWITQLGPDGNVLIGEAGIAPP
jgi:serine/threonine-protein kinase